MSGAAAKPAVREIRNLWLCRWDGQRIEPLFCTLSLDNGRIAHIRPGDYRAYLRERRSGSQTRDPAPDTPCPSSPAGGVIDAEARVATSPFVNFHDHLYSRLAKGLALPGPMHDFRRILENLWWRLDQALDAEMVEACAGLGACESLRSGVGYIFDHHSSPGFVAGSLDAVGRILGEAGLRGVLCLETSDRHSPELRRACLEEQRRFLSRSTSSDLLGLVGLHAPFTLSDETLQQAAELCQELERGIHIHLAEDAYEQRFSLDNYDMTAAVRLNRFGVLHRPGILAHGVHLREEDWAVLTQSACALALNPDSNLNNAVGLGRYAEIPAAIPLLAGTDGMHASPSRTLKQLFLLHRHQGGEITESFAFIRRLYTDQLRFVRRFFPDYPGLNPGERADLTIWDYRPPSPFTRDTFWGHLVFGMLEAPAWALCMEGRAVLAEGRLLGLDPEAAARSAAIQGERLFETLGVLPHG